MDNVLSDIIFLQKIEKLTNILLDDLRQRNRPLVFERIPLKCLQSGLGEQRTLAEALAIAALQSRRTSRSVERDEQEVNPNSQSHK